MRNVSGKFVQKIKTHIMSSVIFFSNDCAVCPIVWENNGRNAQATGHQTTLYNAGQLKLQTYTQNVETLLLFHCKNGCT